MKDIILQNPYDGWVKYAVIRYIKAFEPLPYMLIVGNQYSRFGWQQTFRTIRQAKINFTKEFYKGIWEESCEQA